MLKEKRKIIINFLRKNPKATYKEIREKTKIHLERVFTGGLKEAYELAGLNSPRTFERKTKNQKREILIDFVRKNPKAGGQKIKKETKINFQTIFKTTKELFESAGVNYSREIIRRSKKERKREIMELIRKNPEKTISDIIKEYHTNPYNIFKSIKEIYEKVGIEYLGKGRKRRIQKQKEIVDYIKNNKFATQREINKKFNTHVQDVFQRGIFEAYEKAGVIFPHIRLNLYGTVLKKIKNRAKRFEEKIAKKLSSYGKVDRLIKTKRGFADIVLEIKNKKIVVEIKDYQLKEISISQVNQLNNYLEDLRSNAGILICHKKPKKDRYLIGKNTIFILEEHEIKKIPSLIKGL
jgi:arginine repressor